MSDESSLKHATNASIWALSIHILHPLCLMIPPIKYRGVFSHTFVILNNWIINSHLRLCVELILGHIFYQPSRERSLGGLRGEGFNLGLDVYAHLRGHSLAR